MERLPHLQQCPSLHFARCMTLSKNQIPLAATTTRRLHLQLSDLCMLFEPAQHQISRATTTECSLERYFLCTYSCFLFEPCLHLYIAISSKVYIIQGVCAIYHNKCGDDIQANAHKFRLPFIKAATWSG